MSRTHINISLSIPRGKWQSVNMERLGSMIPERSFVLAANYAQAKDFMAVVRRNLTYLSNPESLRGLDDFVVVKLATYMSHPQWYDIDLMLSARRGVMEILISDWR